MKLTLQQAIFTVSNLTKKQKRLMRTINDDYVVPLKVNGKEVFEQTQADEMLDKITELELINKDILALKDEINIANTENFIDNKSLFFILEEVRIKRSILSDYLDLLDSGRTSVETGVGVVRYGTLNRAKINTICEELEKEVNTLSDKIDNINSKIEIEVKLFTIE